MKLATIALLSASVGFLGAQQTTQTETTHTTTTTSVNMNGMLVDQGCYTTHTQSKETNTANNTTATTETSKIVTECPVTDTTTSFGMITQDGKFVRFDDSGNTRVVQMVKSNKEWKNYMNEHKPVRVRVVGTPNGDVVVIKEIR